MVLRTRLRLLLLLPPVAAYNSPPKQQQQMQQQQMQQQQTGHTPGLQTRDTAHTGPTDSLSGSPNSGQRSVPSPVLRSGALSRRFVAFVSVTHNHELLLSHHQLFSHIRVQGSLCFRYINRRISLTTGTHHRASPQTDTQGLTQGLTRHPPPLCLPPQLCPLPTPPHSCAHKEHI